MGSVRTGHPQYELRPGGSEMTVDASNVAEYIAAVVDATLHKGISAQLDAFRCLWLFELQLLLCVIAA